MWHCFFPHPLDSHSPPLFQVQNLTLRTQQTPAAATSGPTPTQPVLPSLALKPTPGGSQPTSAPSQGRNTTQGSPAGAKPSASEGVMEPLKKGDGSGSAPGNMEGRTGLGRAAPTVATHPLIAPGKSSRKNLRPWGILGICQMPYSCVSRSSPDSAVCLFSFKKGRCTHWNKPVLPRSEWPQQ